MTLKRGLAFDRSDRSLRVADLQWLLPVSGGAGLAHLQTILEALDCRLIEGNRMAIDDQADATPELHQAYRRSMDCEQALYEAAVT